MLAKEIPKEKDFDTLDEMLRTLISWKSTLEFLSSDEVPTIQAISCHLILNITKTEDEMTLLDAGPVKSFLQILIDSLKKRFPKYRVKTFAYATDHMLHHYFKGKLNERFRIITNVYKS